MTPLVLRATGAGLGVGIALVLGVHTVLGAGAAGFAVALGVIGAVYLGTLIATPQPRRVWWQEGAAAILTVGLAVAGLLASPLWLVPGYVFHGLWDWAHHGGRWGAAVTDWYPPFCAAVDLFTALAILALYL